MDKPSATTPITGLAGLAPGDALDSARLLGVTLALASEVFVLKAEVERLKQALHAAGTIDEASLARSGDSPAMRRWMAAEESAFATALLRPFTHPDEAPDVTRFMQAR